MQDRIEVVSDIGPPRAPALVAALFALAAVGLLANRETSVEWVGYACGTFLVIGSVSVFRMLDTRRRMQASYRFSRTPGRIVTASLVIGFAAGIIHIWQLATHLAS